MNNTDLSKLALKLLAIYVAVQGLLAMPQLFGSYVMLSNGSEYSSTAWFIAIAITAIIALFALSVVIWKLSNNTKTVIAKNTSTSSHPISEEFCISILGLYLIIYGLTNMLFAASFAFYASQSHSNISYESTKSIVYSAVYLIVSLIGLSLIIKTKGWASLLNKLRLAGTN